MNYLWRFRERPSAVGKFRMRPEVVRKFWRI